MNKIASFTVNHDKLDKGMYLSRTDGDVITYDIRMKKPNGGDYLGNGALHTFEHLFSTYAPHRQSLLLRRALNISRGSAAKYPEPNGRNAATTASRI